MDDLFEKQKGNQPVLNVEHFLFLQLDVKNKGESEMKIENPKEDVEPFHLIWSRETF